MKDVMMDQMCILMMLEILNNLQHARSFRPKAPAQNPRNNEQVFLPGNVYEFPVEQKMSFEHILLG